MINNVFNNKQILITGGTGSFGHKFCDEITRRKVNLKRLVIYSRDEFKQSEMLKRYPNSKFPFLRFFIGDVRDKERLNRAMENINIVIHAAALKQVDIGEYNPMEVIKTNVIGAQNVVEVCLDNNVENILALSTDKASSPVNLYGASKLCSDKIFLAANNISGNKKIKFSVIRYGNVLGSRGSVLPLFINWNKNNLPFKITNTNMTRFSISLKESVDFVFWCIGNNDGGEIFIPKLKCYKITDLAKAINPKAEIKIIGIRYGEKLHEELISASDSINTIETKNCYMILSYFEKEKTENYIKKKKLKRVSSDFRYCSNINSRFLSVNEIRQELKKNKI